MSSTWQELARDPGKKIAAIKAYREETGAGLAEAKDAVEDYMRNAGIEVRNVSGFAVIMSLLLIVLIVSGLVWYFTKP